MEIYNVLDPKSPIYGKIFIEASAGTGKTFAIEHMVLRLILDSVPITEILVVTFTKAGAKDLKKRIHTSLLSISKSLSDKSYPYCYLKEIENLDEAILLIENACALCNEMPIYTIHGFAFHMLSCFAFEAKQDLDIMHFEDERQKDLTLEAILDTLRSETNENSISSVHCTKMMDQFQRKLSSFTHKITQLMQNESNLGEPPSYLDVKEHFATLVGDVSHEELLDQFFLIAENFKRTTNRSKQIHPHLIEQVKALANKDLDTLMLSTPSIIELLHSDNLKKGKTIPKGCLLVNILERVFNIFMEVKNPLFALTHIAKKASIRLEKLEVKSPDAIISSMQKALLQKVFLKKVKEIFSVCIIDEFQDTDPIQWEILSTLFFNSSKLFCTVGDPKQSIYAFRGADLPTYLQAKRNFSARFSLNTNFRSTKHLVDGLNKLFHPKFTPDFLSFEQNCKDLTYREVFANNSSCSKTDFHLYLCPPIKKKSIRASIMEMENTYFFPHIVNTILNLNIEFDTIAILVKDRYQGLRIALYLQRAGIFVKASITTSLIHTSMFSLIETCILLTYSPRNESLIKKLLSHQIIDAPINFLKKDLNDPFMQNLSIKFTQLKSILESKGTGVFLKALMETEIDGKFCLLEILSTSEENYQTMMQIISLLLMNFEKNLLLFITHVQKLNEESFPQLKKQNDTDKKSVTIMTSHLSKGLEFDAVFAISLYTRMKNPPNENEDAFLIDKEKMRLLYVTFTRAKSFLYIYGSTFHDLFALEKGCASPLELFLARVNTSYLSYDKLYEKIYQMKIENLVNNIPIPCTILNQSYPKSNMQDLHEFDVIKPKSLPSYKKKRASVSFSSLPFEKTIPAPVNREALFPYGAKVGHQIHLIFEKVLEEGLYIPWEKEVIYQVIEKSFFQTVLSGFEDIVYQKMKEVFFSPLKNAHQTFCLKDVAPENMWPEVYFEYEMEKGSVSMKGYIDLIVCINDIFYILDWKCNFLEKYDREDLANTMKSNHYEKQAAIYLAALKHFLTSKNLSFENHAGGAFYLFLRAEKEKSIYIPANPMKDKDVLCLI